MTISTDLARVVHVGNGTTTLFSLSGMEQVKTSNVVVTLVAADGTEMPKVLGVDYSLSPAGVTFVVPPAAGVRVVIQRIEPLIQPDQYTTNAPFPAAVTERRFDSVVMGLQQHADAAKRALRAGIEDTANLTVPPVSVRANRLLGFDTQGNVIASPGVQAGGVLFTPFGETLVTAADAPAARGVLGATAVGSGLFTAADAPAARTLLRLGSAARLAAGVIMLRDGSQPPTADTPWGGFRITGLGAPTATGDAATKQYVDSSVAAGFQTAWTALSGTTVDLTGIPNHAREVVLMLRGVNLNADNEHILVQIGTGSTPRTTGYTSVGHTVAGSGIWTSSTSGFVLFRQNNARVYTANMHIVRGGNSTIWTAGFTGFAVETAPLGGILHQVGGGGEVSLPGTFLNMIRLRSSGAASFIAGNAIVQWRS